MIRAPQPLTLGIELPPEEVAECVGLMTDDVVVRAHRPVRASVGNSFVIAEVTASALARATPQLASFRTVLARHPELDGRYSLHLYARNGDRLRARMFAPLAGTFEDPATGSANAPLGALLLSLSGEHARDYVITQGVEMGRPSELYVRAWRENGETYATVSGRCVPVLSGVAHV